MLDEPSPRSQLTVVPPIRSGVRIPRPAAGMHDDLDGGVSSRELLHRACTGESSAWRALVDRHSATLWSAINELGLRDDDARCVWQHAWLSLAQRADEAAASGDVGRWLLVITAVEASRVRLRRWGPTPPRPTDLALVASSRQPAGRNAGA